MPRTTYPTMQSWEESVLASGEAGADTYVGTCFSLHLLV